MLQFFQLFHFLLNLPNLAEREIKFKKLIISIYMYLAKVANMIEMSNLVNLMLLEQKNDGNHRIACWSHDQKMTTLHISNCGIVHG